MINDVYVSGILCAIGALAGIYALIAHLKILCRKQLTPTMIAVPVLLGVLAWATASFEFFSVASPLDSNILMQRLIMVLSWSWLALSISKEHKD